jgi:hypothetical protein
MIAAAFRVPRAVTQGSAMDEIRLHGGYTDFRKQKARIVRFGLLVEQRAAREFFGVADGTRTHDDRNHNLGRNLIDNKGLRRIFGIRPLLEAASVGIVARYLPIISGYLQTVFSQKLLKLV